jgi:hypothetical protein
MRQTTVLYLTLTIGFGSVVIGLLSTQILDLLGSNLESVDPRKVKLIVGVLSALKNQDQRSGIRHTWKKLSAGPPHSSVFFVMPEKSCPVDPFWRIRESTCSGLNIDINF